MLSLSLSLLLTLSHTLTVSLSHTISLHRPLFIVGEDQKLTIKKKHIYKIRNSRGNASGEYGWHDVLYEVCVCLYVCAFSCLYVCVPASVVLFLSVFLGQYVCFDVYIMCVFLYVLFSISKLLFNIISFPYYYELF